MLAALLRANGRDVPVPSATVTALSPQERARMGYALARAGDLLDSGDLGFCVFLAKVEKKLDNERRLYEDKRKEYESLIQSLPIGRNLL